MKPPLCLDSVDDLPFAPADEWRAELRRVYLGPDVEIGRSIRVPRHLRGPWFADVVARDMALESLSSLNAARRKIGDVVDVTYFRRAAARTALTARKRLQEST